MHASRLPALRQGLAPLLLAVLAACAGDTPGELRFVPEWGCLAGSIAGAAALAATPPPGGGRALSCPRGGPGMPEASFRAADANGDGQVPLAELLALAERLAGGRESLTVSETPWLSPAQLRRVDPEGTGRVALARLRLAIAQDFTRADRDGSATLTPGRWPLEAAP